MKESLQVIREGCWQTIGIWGDRSCTELPSVSICNTCPTYLQAGQNIMNRPVSRSDDEYMLPRQDEETISNHDDRGYVIVRIGQSWFALPSMSIRQVIPCTNVHKLPNHNQGVGLVSIDGEISLFVSGRLLLGVASIDEPALSHPKMFIVAYHDNQTTVFDIDYIRIVRKISDSQIVPVPVRADVFSRAWVRGTVAEGGELISVIDLECAIKSLPEKLA